LYSNPSAFQLKKRNQHFGADYVALTEIQTARERLPSSIRRTPVIPLSRCSSEVGHERLFLKAENLQVTGAYKPRAAFTVMNLLSEPERKRGVVLSSSGNFAQAFAWAGSMIETHVVVVMLDQTSTFKVNAARDYGAEVFLCGTNRSSRHNQVLALAEKRGLTIIDTWEDRRIIAGHGTLGLEMIDDHPEIETILVPVSSGGLAAGVATAVKHLHPRLKVIGVQPERANAAYVSLQTGQPTTIDYWNSLADGLSADKPGVLPFRHVQKYLDDIILVTEEEIASAFRTLLLRAKILAEPAGAVAAAAFLSGKTKNTANTLALVSGGNVSQETIQKMLLNSENDPS
jgi:threonine dehydratase